ncbi:MAG: hypothetical protein LIO96_01155 [Lachnospiraceae bacterium]|nr:hypothetical protein [Lachnospiraceae bacterium]
MKQIRMIRISFFICAAAAVAAYWAGYYSGNQSTDPAELVTENTTDIYQEEDDETENLAAESGGENSGTGSLTAESDGEYSGTESLTGESFGEEADIGGLTSENRGEYAGAGTDADGTTDTVESMTGVSPESYYLKKNGSYLAVYRKASEDIYFDTGIRYDELPDALQREAAGGVELSLKIWMLCSGF